MRNSVQLHRSHTHEATSPAAEVQFGGLGQGKKKSGGNERHSEEWGVSLKQQGIVYPTMVGVDS